MVTDEPGHSDLRSVTRATRADPPTRAYPGNGTIPLSTGRWKLEERERWLEAGAGLILGKLGGKEHSRVPPPPRVPQPGQNPQRAQDGHLHDHRGHTGPLGQGP